MGPLVDKKKECDENAPKILCQMDHHIGMMNQIDKKIFFSINKSNIFIIKLVSTLSAGPTMVRIKWLNWLPWNIFSKIFKRSIFGFRLGWQAGHDLAVCTRVSIVAHLTVNNNGWLEFERFLTEVCPIRISRIGNAASHCAATQEVSFFFCCCCWM